MYFSTMILFFLCLTLVFINGSANCGYESCTAGKVGMINVHVVPHTHDDVGWIKTIDGYYTSEVQYILDSVVASLMANPDRRFSYVETAFFYRWWAQQSDYIRHQVQLLVNQGRLVFVLGGWCMNDEASTHYNAIIDQHTRGLEFLRKNFGECGRPRVAWQIDPFGHSREQASLFAQMGYDAVYFARIDYQDHARRFAKRELEMLWKGSDDLGSAGNLFSGAFYYSNYGPPNSSLDWDIYSLNDGIPTVQDDTRLRDYNVDQIVDIAVRFATEMNKTMRGGDVMWLMGDDFNYQNAATWFTNMDKLIKYTNARQAQGSRVNLFYSNPSCYTLAKNQKNLTWPTKSDDFFPYAHRDHAFWTGYFTSRASLKGMVRSTNNYLQVVKQLDVLSGLAPEHSTELKMDVLKRAMGAAQHHDAVSGTEKQFVADDYASRLAEGIAATESVLYHSLSKLSSLNGTDLPRSSICLLTNISSCSVTENANQFYVTLYNPLGREVSSPVRFPVTKAYDVYNPDGSPITAQIIPLSSSTLNIPGRNSSARYELVFIVTLPPLGFKTVFVKSGVGAFKSEFTVPEANSDFFIKNQYLSMFFNSSYGLKLMSHSPSGSLLSITQGLYYYRSMNGKNRVGLDTASGAYIFRPNGSAPLPVGPIFVIGLVKGPVVQEVWQQTGSWGFQVIRLYDGQDRAEVEWTVGPIPVQDLVGKEVISRYTTGINSGDVFYTDANGRQLLERKVDSRPSWVLDQTEPVSGNYYPVNSRIIIKDEKLDRPIQLSVLTDRSQGGSSLRSGEIELMVHRRNLHDDGLGVGEPLNERGPDGKGLVVRGKHYLLLDEIKLSAGKHRDLGEKLFMQPQAVFTPSMLTPQEWGKQYRMQWSCMNISLPDNVHLLTMEAWDGRSWLLRLEHFYSKNEDDKLSKNVTVSLKNMFSCKNITSVVELTLAGNQMMAVAKRLIWNGIQYSPKTILNSNLDVTLSPMQIKTFQVNAQ